jgi:hypothetical protein
MNDELERRLRDGLRRGVLPAAPDALRDRLSRLPTESRGSRLTELLSGLRLAALATAAAVAIAFVLVVRSLPGPTGTGPSASLGSVTTTTPAAIPSSGPTFGPTIGPTSGPSNEASTGPSPSEAATCAPSFVLPATTESVTQITDVRVGAHPGYDRIVFEFAGSGRPQLTIEQKQGAFVQDASGQEIKVPGNTFLVLKLFDASGYPTYTGPSSFSPGYPNLAALVNAGDFEGYVTWIAGLRDINSICYSVSTLANPTRIVIDIVDLGPNPS